MMLGCDAAAGQASAAAALMTVPAKIDIATVHVVQRLWFEGVADVHTGWLARP